MFILSHSHSLSQTQHYSQQARRIKHIHPSQHILRTHDNPTPPSSRAISHNNKIKRSDLPYIDWDVHLGLAECLSGHDNVVVRSSPLLNPRVKNKKQEKKIIPRGFHTSALKLYFYCFSRFRTKVGAVGFAISVDTLEPFGNERNIWNCHVKHPTFLWAMWRWDRVFLQHFLPDIPLLRTKPKYIFPSFLQN